MRVAPKYHEYEDDTQDEVTPARRPGDETRARRSSAMELRLEEDESDREPRCCCSASC